MKRWISALFAGIFMLLLAPPAAFAANTTDYYLDELGMSISIPSEYVVYTRDIKANDPSLSAYGLTQEKVLSYMKDGNIYLNALDEEANFDIAVTMTSAEMEDISALSDTTLSALATGIESAYKDMGITVTKSDIYQHDQTKFIELYLSQVVDGSTIYSLQYYTVYDGKAINIYLHSYTETIGSQKESILKNMVDSVHFGAEPVKAELPAETAAFVYEDKETGLSFTVPANWTESPLSKEREFLDAKFESNFEEGLIIMYGSGDAWAEMTASEKAGLSRADVDNSLVTKADVAEMLGLDESKVSVVTYSGKEYYKAMVTTKDTVYGTNISVTMTYLYRIENGYMYMFSFGDSAASKYYGDFTALMNSVEYPAPAVVESSAPTAAENTSRIDWNSLLWSFVLGLLLTIVIHPLPIWIYRYGVRKAPVAPKKAKIITIVDAVVVFFVMLLLCPSDGGRVSTGALLLWSFVCYNSLTKGYSEPAVQTGGTEDARPVQSDAVFWQTGADSSPEVPEEKTETEPAPACGETRVAPGSGRQFCHMCGNKLLPGSRFCDKCGARLG